MAQTPEPHTYTLPPAAPFTNHGRTPAAWVLMLGASLGVLVFGVGLILNLMWVIIVGIVVALGSLVISQILRSMGMGQPAPAAAVHDENKDWYSA
ncbi:HGxxPAAW family protein [Georgenia subflava]|uniref:Uncharacterized protein n=1 Tax=Georgenia subflava TaxID=1622177 RepID=A0A6N7EPB3_9MICO|nr:HGxxPAAW family protein [Georgenia subflava]MPV38958.1 hypothetical protein [Georgenia subflava]